MGSNISGSFPLVLTKCASLSGAGWHVRWTQVPFSLASFFCCSFSFTCFQETISVLRVFNMLNMYINYLGKNLTLNLFVYNTAHCMLGDVADSSSFALGALVERSFFNSAYSFNIYVIFLVDSHVCGERNNSTFSKRPGECIAVPLPFLLLLIILEDGGSGRKVTDFLIIATLSCLQWHLIVNSICISLNINGWLFKIFLFIMCLLDISFFFSIVLTWNFACFSVKKYFLSKSERVVYIYCSLILYYLYALQTSPMAFYFQSVIFSCTVIFTLM